MTARVVLVGERANGPAPPCARRGRDPAFLLRAGAFRRGAGRARLERLGLTWDAALNLLPPSPVVGDWDPAEARAVARAVAPALAARFDLVVLLGVRVRAAFGLARLPSYCHMCACGSWRRGRADVFPPGHVRILALPHPSGTSRLWNDPATAGRFSAALAAAAALA